MGAALLLVAWFVGRPHAGATGLARIGRTPRLACAGVALLCATAGFIVSGSEEYGIQADPVRVTIAAELAPDEVSEEVRVILGGRDLGVVRVDKDTPKSRLTTSVAATGRHTYHLESTRQKTGRAPEHVTQSSHVVISAKGRLGVFYHPDNTDVFLLAY